MSPAPPLAHRHRSSPAVRQGQSGGRVPVAGEHAPNRPSLSKSGVNDLCSCRVRPIGGSPYSPAPSPASSTPPGRRARKARASSSPWPAARHQFLYFAPSIRAEPQQASFATSSRAVATMSRARTSCPWPPRRLNAHRWPRSSRRRASLRLPRPDRVALQRAGRRRRHQLRHRRPARPHARPGHHGPQRFEERAVVRRAENGGYNTAHTCTAAGRDRPAAGPGLAVLAEGFALASQAIKDHPRRRLS